MYVYDVEKFFISYTIKPVVIAESTSHPTSEYMHSFLKNVPFYFPTDRDHTM